MELYVIFYMMTGTVLDRVPAEVKTLTECEHRLPEFKNNFIRKFVNMTGADPSVVREPWVQFVIGARCEWVMERAPY